MQIALQAYSAFSFKHIKGLICLLYISLALLSGCTNKKAAPAIIPNPEQQETWEYLSAEFFLNLPAKPGNTDILDFAEQLNAMMVNVPAAAQVRVTKTVKQAAHYSANIKPVQNSSKLVFDYNIVKAAIAGSDSSRLRKAAQEHLLQRLKLLLAHQYLSFEGVVLSHHLKELSTDQSELLSYQTNVEALIAKHPVLNTGEFEIYHADNEQRLLAYKRRLGNKSAFIAYNLSFDMHEMPLPFGFMASTKVTVWGSDTQSPQTFVSNSPIIIHPFTVMVIIVG